MNKEAIQDSPTTIKDHSLTKLQQVALAVLPQLVADCRRFEDAVKEAHQVADMFLKEQSWNPETLNRRAITRAAAAIAQIKDSRRCVMTLMEA